MTIKLNGRIDSNNASAVEQSVLKQIEQGDKTSLVLDAAELEYISSAGLRVLLDAMQAMEEKGKLVVRNVAPPR